MQDIRIRASSPYTAGFIGKSFARLAIVFCLLGTVPLRAATGGSISGTVRDASGAVILRAALTLVNSAQQTTYRAVTDDEGLYSFPNLPVGHYDLTISADGFQIQRKTNLTVDTDSALRVDATLDVGVRSEAVTVSVEGTGVEVDTIATHLGEVVSSSQMTSLPLNGRSYTDLLAIQPGVAPISTLLPSSVIMAGVTGSIDPSGDENPGNLSINGQRESSNGFIVNGIDVQEHMNGGTSIVPNIDSMEEFRVLTNNFDPEYGNYNGGIVTVISKGGTNGFHGDAFEFLRNTALDARGYFDPTRSAFRQNQFGGTLGGPVKRDKVFFFADYQGTRTDQGVSTGYITVPTLAERTGTFNDLTGSVSGPYLASLLTKELGYTVTSQEPYSSVFPGGMIPQRAWSAPGKFMFQYIPSPNIGTDQYSTSAFSQTVRDDKGAARVDANSRVGQISGYYFIDDYYLDNPYPGSVAGASIPGFNALYIGRAQLFSLGISKLIGTSIVNEFHAGYLRNANILGQPKGGFGISLASQGFASVANGGIYPQAPQFIGVENITFPTFVMGVPITNMTQINNTYYLSDGVSKVIGAHTLKVGAQFHIDQVNDFPNGTFNGTFNVDGTETGDPFADLLLGVASNFTQTSGSPLYLRNRYEGVYGQDSWRARSDLTVNMGLRWDVIVPFWEKYNQIQTWVPGRQSIVYPGAFPGMVYPGDPGIPRTLAPTDYKNLAPRIGFAYAPRFGDRFWRALFGGDGKSSIRASYGIFYTEFPGLAAGVMYGVPPYGFNYLSPAPPLLAAPFINAGNGVQNAQPFPFPFPPHGVSASHPDNSVNWDTFAGMAADPFFNYRNRPPYISNYMFSVQRQITNNALLTVSYVGNQGHRILSVVDANLGNPALCQSFASQGCVPFAEDNTYTGPSGAPIYGTRNLPGDQNTYVGPNPPFEYYGENASQSTVANSNYNALEATLRYQRHGTQFLLSYAYAKSIDQGSNLGEQIDPRDPRHQRAISAWDQKHAFVASYTLALPVQRALRRSNRWTDDWSLSGTTRFATGFPVTLTDNSDNSLLGTLGNGINNYLLDTPQQLPGRLEINTNGRNGRPAFNTALFPIEAYGTLGSAKRRVFYGPGIENFDLALHKTVRVAEGRSFEFRAEAFNALNHAQFYGPASVDGQVDDTKHFGDIVSAASPRLMQLAAKFNF